MECGGLLCTVKRIETKTIIGKEKGRKNTTKTFMGNIIIITTTIVLMILVARVS